MKASVALSLCLAPIVLAKAVHNVYPVPRGESSSKDASKSNSNDNKNNNNDKSNNNNNDNNNNDLLDQILEEELALILLWKFAGGSSATTATINSQVTITQTKGSGSQQTGGSVVTSAPAAVVTGTGKTHPVTVGGAAGLAFDPPTVNAAVGDTVEFTFMSTNHTVSQSAFATPCELLAGGMDSGFQPNPNNTVVPPPKVAMQVMVATPLWFYCRQKGHCGKGMTFSVNPTAEKTQAQFQQQAIAQNGTGTGGAITGNGGSSVAVPGSSATASAADVSATVSVAGASAPAPSPTDAAGAASGTGVVSGTGTLQGDGSCFCAVQCAAGAFPAAAQGNGAFGGIPGAIPISMAVTA